jgi:hypothetical protein
MSNRIRHTNNFLPIEVLVLQGYLSVKDISNLDIAIGDDELRLLFLCSLQSIKIRDDAKVGRGDDFVTWIIKRQIKLLNFKGLPSTFTRKSALKMATGLMKLDVIEDLTLARYFIRIWNFSPMLQRLNLSDCTTITERAIINVAECCPLLENLWLPSDSTITDIAMIRVAECCSMLQTFFLHCSPNHIVLPNDCPKITDTALIRIAECCPLLLNLCLYSSTITDVGIGRIAESCPKLQNLSLRYSKSISDIAINKITECCPMLESLSLNYPTTLDLPTNLALNRIIACCPMLQSLSFHCPDGIIKIYVSLFRLQLGRALH